jgi:AcrR family transcriptional regulator
MNMASPSRATTGAPTSLRAQSKLKTRQRVLDAARALFMERGYEAATIRDIAGTAGLSTGAVFASFVDKTDLFNAVMDEDFQRIMDGLAAAQNPDAGVDDGVLGVFKVGYGFHFAQLPLLQAAIGLSWSHGLGGEFGNRPSYKLAVEAVTAALRRGVERGELAADADLPLIAELLWDGYVANYRRALFDGWSQDQLIARAAAQIALVLKGARAPRAH